MQKIAFSNYSGGKDSHYAIYKALKEGYSIPFIFTFNAGKIHHKIFNDFLKIKILKEQSRLMGIRLIEYKFDEYKIPFIEAIKEIHRKEIKGKFSKITFYSSMDYEIREKKDGLLIRDILSLFKKLNIKYKSAVKGKTTTEMIKDSLKAGIYFIITAVEKNIDDFWLGKEAGDNFIEYIIKENRKGNYIDANDFQTLVIRSPLMRKKLKIESWEIVSEKDDTTSSKIMKIKRFKFI
ncbi:MAG: hypothetical protein AB1602_06285 [Elusimicrobiota bacterium]